MPPLPAAGVVLVAVRPALALLGITPGLPAVAGARVPAADGVRPVPPLIAAGGVLPVWAWPPGVCESVPEGWPLPLQATIANPQIEISLRESLSIAFTISATQHFGESPFAA